MYVRSSVKFWYTRWSTRMSEGKGQRSDDEHLLSAICRTLTPHLFKSTSLTWRVCQMTSAHRHGCQLSPVMSGPVSCHPGSESFPDRIIKAREANCGSGRGSREADLCHLIFNRRGLSALIGGAGRHPPCAGQVTSLTGPLGYFQFRIGSRIKERHPLLGGGRFGIHPL